MSGTAATSPAQEFERLYILRNDSEVRRFINQHQFLEPLLREVHARVQNYFPGSPLFLEVFTDPEDQGEQELVASVSTGLPSPAAHEKLTQFDHEWWLASLARAQSKLSVTLEFR